MNASMHWFMIAAAAVGPSLAHAQAGVTAGNEYGFGGIARFGDRTALEIGAGIAPVLALNLTVGEDSKVYFPLAVGGKISVPLRAANHDKPLGLKFGVTHNGVLKTGYGAGIDLVLARKPVLVLGATLMYYPDAQQGLTDRVNEDSGTSYTTVIDESVKIQPGVSLSILWPRARR